MGEIKPQAEALMIYVLLEVLDKPLEARWGNTSLMQGG
jgi:hypothetical protein